jgi:hypothetical protein
MQRRKREIECADKAELLPQPEKEGRSIHGKITSSHVFVISCILLPFLVSLVVVTQRTKREIEGTAEEAGFRDIKRAHNDAKSAEGAILT